MDNPQPGTSSEGSTDDQLKMAFIKEVKGTYRHVKSKYLCPLCFKLYDNPYVTKCGHTFCHKCISVHLQRIKKCPVCTVIIKNDSQMVPNVTMKKLALKYRSINESINNEVNIDKRGGCSSDFPALETPQNATAPIDLCNIFANVKTLSDVNAAIQILKERKNSVETNQYIRVSALLYKFTKYFMQDYEIKLKHEKKLIEILGVDYEQAKCNSADSQEKNPRIKDNDSNKCISFHQNIGTDETKLLFKVKRKFITKNFLNFRQCYFDTRVKRTNSCVDGSVPSDFRESTFHKDFEKCLRYRSFKLVATFDYLPDIFSCSNIVSGVEFDRDEEFIALAGVSKEVKVYNYNAIINDVVDSHYPSTHCTSDSKISSLAWNPFHKYMLAWSDYDGAVTFWDVKSKKSPKLYYEHDKRCWSVDFSNIDPNLLASGSDDGRLKIWSVSLQKSVSTIETKSNICSVKFNPNNSHDIAFGSADHNIYYYDLRNSSEALGVLKGHKKTVSYIKFIDKETIVSASTDSQLKLWNVEKLSCIRNLTGHRNEKNFVGLATDGDYIACGSENNSVYIYYKTMEKPVFEHKIQYEVGDLNERPIDKEHSHKFISAVAWRKRSSSVVAANSQGIVNIINLSDETN